MCGIVFVVCCHPVWCVIHTWYIYFVTPRKLLLQLLYHLLAHTNGLCHVDSLSWPPQHQDLHLSPRYSILAGTLARRTLERLRARRLLRSRPLFIAVARIALRIRPAIGIFVRRCLAKPSPATRHQPYSPGAARTRAKMCGHAGGADDEAADVVAMPRLMYSSTAR